MSKIRETAGKTMLVSGARFVGVAISVAAVVFYTRFLTKTELAFAAVVTLLGETMYQVGDLGIGIAVEARLPSILQRDPEEGLRMISAFIWVLLITAGALSLLTYGLATPLAVGLLQDASYAELLVLSIPVMVATVWKNFLQSLMRGVDEYTRLVIFAISTQVCFTVLAIAGFVAMGIRGLVLGITVGTVLPCLYESWKLRAYLLRLPSFRSAWALIRLSWPYYSERFFNYAYTNADLWLVAWRLNTAALATYYVPRTFFDRLISLLDGFWSVPMTALSRESARGLDVAARGLAQLQRTFIYVFLPISAAIAASSYFLVDVLAGPQYRADAVVPFAVLTIMFLLRGVSSAHALGVLIISQPRERLWTIFIQNACFLAALFVLIDPAGLIGVVSARGVGAAGLAVASWYVLKRTLPAPIDWAAVRIALGPSLVAALVVLGGQFLFYHRAAVPLYLLAGGVLYLVLFFRQASESDLRLFEQVMPARFQKYLSLARRLRPEAT